MVLVKHGIKTIPIVALPMIIFIIVMAQPSLQFYASHRYSDDFCGTSHGCFYCLKANQAGCAMACVMIGHRHCDTFSEGIGVVIATSPHDVGIEKINIMIQILTK